MADDDIAIRVDNVSKTFKLPHEKNTSIKSAVVNFWRRDKGYEMQKALENVSLEVKKGEFFGIVGRNGSGKSTLLKLLAGIYTPDSGNIQINGKLTPFIELGVGFSPELTGRENVFLNGSLLGFNRKEMEAMYHDIVEFAELERFMDQKLKNYSSGMQVRLAFSIAIRAQTDILVLDEVLAVGDEAFQQKCIDVFEDYKANKQTIVLVTHSMEMVKRFCTRAMLIDDGEIVECGDPNKVANRYSQLNDSNYDPSNIIDGSRIKLSIGDSNGTVVNKFMSGDKMRVSVTWPTTLKIKNVGVAIHKNSGEYIFGTNTFSERLKIKGNQLCYEVQLDLGEGKYHLAAAIFGKNSREVIDYLDYGGGFKIDDKLSKSDQGLAKLKHKWFVKN